MTSERIDAKEVVRQLTRKRDDEEAPVYTLRDKTITGKLNLKHRTIEVAVDIQNCDFLEEVDLRYCEFNQAVFFSYCRFHKRFNSGNNVESHTVYHKGLNCMGAVFEGPFEFNGGMVESSAYFSGAKFLKEESIGFARTSVAGILDCRGATFTGNAAFNSLNCEGTAFFEGATFEGESNFAYATFGRNLECLEATFTGKAYFTNLDCKGSAFLAPATFEGEVDFSHATFGENLVCRGVTFTGKAYFDVLKCGGSAFFSPFPPPSSERESKPTIFKGEVRFVRASISGFLHCECSQFRGDVTLYRSQIGTLALNTPFKDSVDPEEALPFQEDSHVNLHECHFDSFVGDASVAREMAAKQSPNSFSRDPYLQLEKYYRGVGNDLEAKRMHFTGRKELRKNAKDPNGVTQWGLFTSWGDWWIKWLTGYGVRTWQLLVPITTLLIVGVVVFWGNNALLPASAQEQGAPNGAQVERTHLLSTQPEQAQESGPLGQHLFERAVYSLDLFLPVVNLQVAEKWEPNGLGREIYAVIHSMVGWILVPLLLASLSGIIRRE